MGPKNTDPWPPLSAEEIATLAHLANRAAMSMAQLRSLKSTDAGTRALKGLTNLASDPFGRDCSPALERLARIIERTSEAEEKLGYTHYLKKNGHSPIVEGGNEQPDNVVHIAPEGVD